MNLFDSHCHLTHERFDGEVDAVLARAREHGVGRVVTIATEPEDTDRAIELAGRHDGVWATAGIHPHEAERRALERIREFTNHERVVAVGETGLDYYYDNAPRERQRRAFRAQLELAAKLGLPVVVHSREADEDTAALVRAFAGDVRGVLHCFAGGPELFEAGIDAGWYVSFSGLVTFNSFRADDLIRAVPADRLLIETDSPFLAPVPKRGKRNEPAFVRHVAERVAKVRGEPADDLARRTAENTAAFYGLGAP